MDRQPIATDHGVDLVGRAMSKAERTEHSNDRPPKGDDKKVEKLLLIGAALTKDDGLGELLRDDDGLSLVAAANAREGLRVLREQHPSVVIVDHHLDDRDGVRVLEEIQSLATECRTILITSDGGMDVAIDVMRAGALDYLSRPVDLEQLRRSLERARESATYRRPQSPPVVLVLEDHAPTQRQLQQTLEKEGYRVFVGDDGEEGLRVCSEHRVDVILADLQMPNKTGLDVLEETKGRGVDVEVILVTAHGDEDAVVQALRLGAANFLKKPIDLEWTLRTVGDTLARGIQVKA